MAKFKVGDKVRVRDDADGYYMEPPMKAMRGKIVTISYLDSDDKMQYKIAEFRYWWDESLFEEITTEQPRREFIVIHRSGNVMTAEHRVNREIIKSAKATCAPSDTFDFETGAKLAFDRLMGREEPKPAPKSTHKFKVGDRVQFGNRPVFGNVRDVRGSMVEIETENGEFLVAASKNFSPAPAPEPQPAHRFKVGDRVLHEEYGLGTIIGYVNHVAGVPYKVRPDNVCCVTDNWAESRVSPAPAPEPPKFYTGKVVMVDCEFPDRKHLINHLFEFKDGRQVGNKMHGMSFNHAPYTSFGQIALAHNASTWIEVEE